MSLLASEATSAARTKVVGARGLASDSYVRGWPRCASQHPQGSERSADHWRVIKAPVHSQGSQRSHQQQHRRRRRQRPVRDGETIIVSYGRNRRKVAAMVPYAELKPPRKRPLGLLKSNVRVKFGRNFALTDDEFLEA